ncbi:MAG: NAD(P)-dependent oxidoreductase [Gammaproteobacteria bacterium]
MKIAFIGLGRMGQGMARRILDAGHELVVYHKVAEKAKSLQQAGAIVAGSVAEATKNREVVVTMLPGDLSLEDVVYSDRGLLASMEKGAIHMAMGTHGVNLVRALTLSHTKAGQIFVAAPVLGRPDLAAAGELRIIPGGPSNALKRLQPLFGALGKQIFQAGSDPQAATVVKVAHNFVLGCAIEVMGEAFAMVHKLGVEPALLHGVLTRGLFNAPAYQVYGKLIIDEAYDNIGATALIGLKDVNLALAAAELAEMPLPSANVLRDRLLGAIAHGEGGLDWAVVARDQARASGLWWD